ncbi:RadC family protein [Pontivivens ytuae]|nr:DNA repair protein RadC [Pontivivens ytuae]
MKDAPPLPGFSEAPQSFPATGARPDQVNHRARLRARFMAGGADALPDYELLELVLFRAIPRRDVKPLAKALMARFGDFNAVISAPTARLTEVQGVGDAVVQELKIVEAAAHRLARAEVMGREVISSWDALVRYCRIVLSHAPTERFRILFLDRRNILIADEVQQSGTVDHVPVYPREVARRALELGASALILVHNHPSGDPTPSQADVDMTRTIEAALRPLDIVLHDHIVVGKGHEVSLRAGGYL